MHLDCRVWCIDHPHTGYRLFSIHLCNFLMCSRPILNMTRGNCRTVRWPAARPCFIKGAMSAAGSSPSPRPQFRIRLVELTNTIRTILGPRFMGRTKCARGSSLLAISVEEAISRSAIQTLRGGADPSFRGADMLVHRSVIASLDNTRQSTGCGHS